MKVHKMPGWLHRNGKDKNVLCSAMGQPLTVYHLGENHVTMAREVTAEQLRELADMVEANDTGLAPPVPVVYDSGDPKPE